jgi:hypothetical protein
MSKLLRLISVVTCVFIVAGLATMAGCASGSGTRSNAPVSSRMDTTEFRRPEFRTIYDAVAARRPDWLIARGGATSMTNAARQAPVVGVFFEGESRGYPLEKLRELVGRDVRTLRRISGAESVATYGPDWPWGGIVVTRER